MKKLLIAALAIIAVLAVLLYLQIKKPEPKAAAAAPPNATNDAGSRVQQGTNGETIVRVDVATQTLMGLQTADLPATELASEIKAYGRVVDPVALSAIASELLAARATAEVSRKELARLKILAGENNAAARTVEAAAGTAQRDDAVAETARAKLVAATGPTIADRTNLVDFMKSLASGEAALVELDLPAGETLNTAPVTASLFPLGHESQPVEGRFAGSPPGVDPLTQARQFLFLVETNQARLAPGSAVTGYLKTAGETQAGVTVPRDAIIRFNGATWIYLQTGDDVFQRIQVELKRPLDDGWFATVTWKGGRKAVTVGAQQLLSEELKSQASGD